MAEKRDPQIIALEAVHAALKDLDVETRKKVLSSVFALLGVEGLSLTAPQSQPTATYPQAAVSPVASASPSRPMSPIELMQEKKPQTNVERIALFAYYREKYEGQSRFARQDLSGYFAKAKLAPAGNFDRDFVKAVKKGWIHEDDADSYLTSKGIEAVESGFSSESRTARAQSPKKSLRRNK